MERRLPIIDPPNFGLALKAKSLRKIKARRIRPGLPGDFPTRKGTIPSLRTKNLLEMDALGHFEVDPDIEMMALRSHVVIWDDPQPNGSSKLREFIPTLTLRKRNGAVCVLDIRSAKEADTTEWRRTEAFLKIDYRRLKASFATLTDETVYVQPRHGNVTRLLQMLTSAPDREALDRTRVAILSMPTPTTVGAVAERLKFPNPNGCADPAFVSLVEMAVTGEVRLDLSRPLGLDTAVSIPSGTLADPGRAR